MAAVEDPELPSLEVVDVPAGTSAEQLRRDQQSTIFAKPKHLTAKELVRLRLYRLGPDDAYLLLSIHHAVSDGVSLGQFAQELEAVYNGEAPAAVGDYFDAVADAGEPSAASRDYWIGQLANRGDVPELPYDRDGAAGDGADAPVIVPVDGDQVGALATRLGVSRFAVVAALSQALLGRAAAAETMALSFQSAGRRGIEGAERAIGPFSNALVLTADLRGDLPFEALARDQSGRIRAALVHEDYSYSAVIRDTGVQPTFGLNWFPSAPPLRLAGLEPAPRELVDTRTNYDVDLRFVEEEDRLSLVIYFPEHRFGRDRIEAIGGDFIGALARAAEDPTRAIAALFDPPAPLIVPQPGTVSNERLFDGFLRQARAEPDRVALLGEGWRMTYGEVEAASASLARRLIARGIGPNSRVAILAERGPQLVCIEIGALRVGATIVPLDSSYPAERLRLLMEVADPDLLVLPRAGGRPDWSGAHIPVLAADAPAEAGGGPIAEAALSAGDPDAPAYILFTSGSTGVPKAVATSHRPVLNFLQWQRTTFGITREDRFTNLNGIAHDMMVRDIFQPLSIGGQLAIPAQEDIYRAGRLMEWIAAMRPTVAHLTPAMGRLMVMARAAGQTLPLRCVFFGGDRLMPELTRQLRELAPDALIVNFFGTTETPQAAAFHIVDDEVPWRSHPIGRGIDGFSIRIVDDEHRPLPSGAPGEIAVITPFLSLGYVRDGEIVPHADPTTYYTGDTGFALPGGEIMFTGRRDDQVSIRGYRIELEEIARALAGISGVRESQVLLEGGDLNPRLVAFVTSAAGASPDPDVLHAELVRNLPSYMVPQEIVVLPRFPLLPNGKLDRKGLLAAPRPKRELGAGRAAHTDMERRLSTIWSEILGGGKISPDRSFAELRGDSLNFVQVYLATEAEVGDLPDDWQAMPLAEIAKLGDAKVEGRHWIKWIDTPVFVRSIAIVLVVMLHLEVFTVGGGSTSALFMVSGFLIARFQLREVFRERSVQPLWRLLGRVMLPSALYVALLSSAKILAGQPVAVEVLLFLEDFVDMQDSDLVHQQGHVIPLWYIASFLHMILILIAVLSIMFRFSKREVSPERVVLGLVAAGFALRFLLPALVSAEYRVEGFGTMSASSHWPTTSFGVLMLGMGAGLVQARSSRQLYAVLVAAMAFLSGFVTETATPYMIGLAGFLLLYVPRLPALRVLHWPALMLSSASLFIYLTHQQVARLFVAIGVPEQSLLLVIAALVGGIGLWVAWQKLTPLVLGMRFRRRLDQVAAQESI